MLLLEGALGDPLRRFDDMLASYRLTGRSRGCWKHHPSASACGTGTAILWGEAVTRGERTIAMDECHGAAERVLILASVDHQHAHGFRAAREVLAAQQQVWQHG